jgi:Txe/YoeB family toxin of Txe-Axe toxin-antitoxin module
MVKRPADFFRNYFWGRRINELIKDCQRNPYEGIGKPEPLKWNLSALY